MRKDMKLDVEEFVRVEVRAPVIIEEYFKSWKEHIMKETRCSKGVHPPHPRVKRSPAGRWRSTGSISGYPPSASRRASMTGEDTWYIPGGGAGPGQGGEDQDG
jgi:hypothetical protein